MGGLSARKKRAILALAEHGNVTRAADACGISRQALHRWMREPLFEQELRQVSSEMVSQASRRLTSLLLRAVDELERILDTGTVRERLRAAEMVLTHALRLREQTDIEERLTELERAIANR